MPSSVQRAHTTLRWPLRCSSSPTLPALGHYERLYFAVQAYDNADHYGYACPDGIENHLATVDQLDCRTTGSCVYLWVDDAAACRTLEVLTESNVKSRVLP